MSLHIVGGEGGVCRASLEGDLTIYTVSALKGEIGQALAEAAELEIDLSGSGEIDAAGLQLMLMAKRLPGKTVRFANHPPAVLQLLELSNLAGELGDPLLLSAHDPALP